MEANIIVKKRQNPGRESDFGSSEYKPEFLIFEA
jgi:hypothetical protein